MEQLALGLDVQSLPQSATEEQVSAPHAPWLGDVKTADNDLTSAQEAINDIQLARLATAILSKGSQDLLALAETNPALFDEWQAAFRLQYAEAEKSARRWASAAASLATIKSIAEARKDFGITCK